MRVTYDAEANSIHIGFLDIPSGEVFEDFVCEAEQLRGDVVLWLDKNGQLLGMALLNAREMVPRAFLDGVERV